MDNSLDEMLDLIDMESYLDREGLAYKVTPGSSGVQLNIRECPVCGSSKWKVYINADSGLGNCFAGDHPPGENFSKWKFIKANLGTENNREVVDHIKVIAREMGWRARKTTSREVKFEKPDLVLPESLPIPIDGKNLRYLAERNVDTKTAQYFHLRYSINGVFWYRMPDGEVRHQDYKQRIIIPVFDIEGNLVSFQGRDITGKQEPKYLFPPGFSATGKYLYNGHNAVGAKRVAVCEGAFDVMAVKIALDEEMDLRDVVPVGTFGKHLSDGSAECTDQLGQFLYLKERGLEEVVFMWDGEVRALSDAADAALRLASLGLSVKVAILPQDRDPNEVAPQVVRQAFWQARRATKANMIRLKMGVRK